MSGLSPLKLGISRLYSLDLNSAIFKRVYLGSSSLLSLIGVLRIPRTPFIEIELGEFRLSLSVYPAVQLFFCLWWWNSLRIYMCTHGRKHEEELAELSFNLIDRCSIFKLENLQSKSLFIPFFLNDSQTTIKTLSSLTLNSKIVQDYRRFL